MSRAWLQYLITLLLVLVGSMPEAAAQTTKYPHDLSDVILALPFTLGTNQRQYNDARLFDGLVTAKINDNNGNNNDFDRNSDTIVFRVRPRDGITLKNGPTGEGFDRDFAQPKTRTDFENWAKDHTADLLKVLFPSGLAAAVSGRNVSTLYSQQLFFNTMLDTSVGEERRQRPSAALFETEWINVDKTIDPTGGDKTPYALQGLYAFTPMLSVQARYSTLPRALSTTATSAAVDFHPFIERGDYRDSVLVRAGGLGRFGFIYSSTEPFPNTPVTFTKSIPLPLFDYSGGGWASVMRSVGPVLVGGASLFQITKHQALALDSQEGQFVRMLVDAINDRGLEYDMTVGGTARLPLSNKTAVIGSYAGTFGLNSEIDRDASHAVMGAVMYTLGPGVTLNGGYKTTSLTGARAHSLFFQGNFGW